MKSHLASLQKHISVALFLFVSVFFCMEPAHSDNKEILIGFIGPLSGDVANFGNEAKDAIAIAIQEINESQYIPGINLKVIYEDGKCTGKDASAAAQKLVNIDGVKLILGGVCSGETLAAAKITEPAKVILLASFASNPAISQAGDFVFRNCIKDRDGGLAAGNLIIQRKLKRPASLGENTDYCLGLKDSLKEVLEKNGIKLVADEVINPTELDFRSVILRLRSKRPDVLFVNMQGGHKAGLVVKQIREMGLDIPIIGNNVFSSADFKASAGGIDRINGIIFVDAPSIVTDRAKALLAKYKRLHGDIIQSDFSIAFSYDAVYLLADAIRTVGLDTSKIRDYFYRLPNFAGVAYNYHFDQNGDMVGVPYGVKQIRNGVVENLPVE